MNKEYKSSLFFSDLVKEKIEYLLPSYPAVEKLSAIFHEMAERIDTHLADWGEKGVIHILPHIDVSEISDHNARFLLTLTLTGSAPWSEERIADYRADVQAKKQADEKEQAEFLKTEKENIAQLESLIADYPETAAKMLADLLAKKKE